MQIPSINNRGEVAHGIAGGYLNINNERMIPGASIGFMDDDHIAFTNANDVIDGQYWAVSVWHVPTRTWSRISPCAANVGYAGGGFVTWESPTPAFYGLNSTTGFSGNLLAPLGIGQNGSIAYKVRDSFGPCKLRRLDNTEFIFTLNDAKDVTIPQPDSVLWMDWVGNVGKLMVVGLPPINTIGESWFPQAVFFRGEWWLCKQNGQFGTIAHPFS